MTPGSRIRRRAAVAAGCGIAALGLAACGGDPSGERAPGTKFALYVNVPLRGPWGAQGIAVANGAKLAIDDQRGGAGPFAIRLTVRDTTSPDDGATLGRDGAAVQGAAALRDPGAIGVVGGVDGTGNVVTTQLAGQTGIPTVIASGGRAGTSTADLSPRGTRGFVDLSASDDAVTAAASARLRAQRCRRIATVRVGLPEVPLRPRTAAGATYRDAALATAVRRELRSADCLLVDGSSAAGDPAVLLGALAPALRGTRVVVTRGAASGSLATLARTRGLSVEAIVDDQAPDAGPDGRRIDAEYRRSYGIPAPPGAYDGYRATVLILRAFSAAGYDPESTVVRTTLRRELLAAKVPGVTGDVPQGADGSTPDPPVSIARPTADGWRVVAAAPSR